MTKDPLGKATLVDLWLTALRLPSIFVSLLLSTVQLGYAAPSITGISPNTGPVIGGTLITISGNGFVAGATATIGGVPIVGPSLDPFGRIFGVTGPSERAGTFNVVVTNPDGSSGTLANGFTYGGESAPLSITFIFPPFGPISGGTLFVILGNSFQEGASVTLGGAPAIVEDVVDIGIVGTTGPRATAGVVDVVVTNPGGASATLSNGFTYTSGILTISGISPASGPIAGGTSVQVTGTGFLPGAVLVIGGAPASSVNVVSATQLSAITGPGAFPGPSEVFVVNVTGEVGTLTNGFNYTAVPLTLTSISPSSLQEGAPSFSLTVNGTNFTSGVLVLWNGVARVTQFVSSTQVIAAIPTTDVLLPGTASVNVSLGGVTAPTPLPFTIAANTAPIEVTGILPSSGSTKGNTRITILGKNFKPRTVSPSLVAGEALSSNETVDEPCPFKLGGQCITSLVFVSSEQITGDAPASSSGASDITYTRDDGTQGTLPQAFTYKTLPPVPPVGVGPGGVPKNRQRLPFVVDTAAFRTNLGINNLGASQASVDVFLIDKNGEIVASKAYSVPGNGMTQVNNIARDLEGAAQQTGREGYLLLESSDKFSAWASQVDNLTADPSLEQARSEALAASRTLIPSSASVGAFLTSLVVINNSPAAGQVTIRSRRTDGTVQAQLNNLAIQGNGYLYFEDLYRQVGLTGVFGPIEVEASGSIKITATARIYTREGTSGYFEGVDAALASQIVVLPYALDTRDFRTNLGITNPSGTEVSFTVSLIDKNGLSVGAPQNGQVPANGMVQINNINRALLGAGDITNREGYLKLSSTGPLFFGWTSQIDNLTQDLSLFAGKAASLATRLLIPSTTSLGSFRSTLVVVNLSPTPTSVKITARTNEGGERGFVTLAIPGGGFVSYNDILGSLGLSGTFGPLEITSTDNKPILAVSRVYSTQRTGGYFEGVPVGP